MELKRLRVLQALAEHGTVAAAAQRLHLTPSAVSQQLAVLAKEAGAPLLEKHGRGVRLTGAAHVLLSHADAIAARIEQARADIAAQAAGETGRARVAGFPSGISEVIAPAVARLKISHPGWHFEVAQWETEDSLPRLVAGDLDLAVVMTSPTLPGTDHPRIELHSLLSEPFQVGLPADSPLAAFKELGLAEHLAGEDWVIPDEGTACHSVIMTACHQAGFQPHLVHRMTDFGAMFAMIAAGLGVTLVPAIAENLVPPGMVLRPVAGFTPRRHILAAVRRGTGVTPLLEALRTVGRELTLRHEPHPVGDDLSTQC
jgi:DNA-binding transcriptional LysR family regulator